MSNKEAKRETPTPTLLEVLDEWGRLNEKRMKGKHSRQANKLTIIH